MSKALVKQGTTKDVIAEQVKTLTRVLDSYKPWLKTSSLQLAKVGEASAVLVSIRELIDTAESGRKTLTKPLLDEKRDIDNAYKPFSKAAETLQNHVGKLLIVAQAEERAHLAKIAEKDAKKLEKIGASQAAQDVRDQALMAPVISSIGEGLTTQQVVRANVTDVIALCKAIVEGKLPTDVIEPSQSKLNALARANAIPDGVGVERVIEEVLRRSA